MRTMLGETRDGFFCFLYLSGDIGSCFFFCWFLERLGKIPITPHCFLALNLTFLTGQAETGPCRALYQIFSIQSLSCL